MPIIEFGSELFSTMHTEEHQEIKPNIFQEAGQLDRNKYHERDIGPVFDAKGKMLARSIVGKPDVFLNRSKHQPNHQA